MDRLMFILTKTCTYNVTRCVPEQRTRTVYKKVCKIVPETKTCTYNVTRCVPQQQVRTVTCKVARGVPEQVSKGVNYKVCKVVPEVKTCTVYDTVMKPVQYVKNVCGYQLVCTKVPSTVTRTVPRVCTYQVPVQVNVCAPCAPTCAPCAPTEAAAAASSCN